MKCELSIQEKLKDLRVEKGLSLEELGKETGLSKSALGSYESNDYKDISHTALITLAKYYGVSADYLMGFSENKSLSYTSISKLKLDDETISILKSGIINNRLLCEIIKHPDFWKFMSDTEIYIDSLASMQINNLNGFVATSLLQHNLYKWEIKRGELVVEDDINNRARVFDKTVNEWIEGLDQEHRQKFVDSLYDIITSCDADNRVDFVANFVRNVSQIRKTLQELDEETSQMMKEVMRVLLTSATINFAEEYIRNVLYK